MFDANMRRLIDLKLFTKVVTEEVKQKLSKRSTEVDNSPRKI